MTAENTEITKREKTKKRFNRRWTQMNADKNNAGAGILWGSVDGYGLWRDGLTGWFGEGNSSAFICVYLRLKYPAKRL